MEDNPLVYGTISVDLIIDDEDKYSLGGQGQDPKAGLVGPLTQPVQLEGNGNGEFLVRMTLISCQTAVQHRKLIL